MCEYRAARSGLALEAQKKNEACYNQEEAHRCMEWVSRTIGEPLNTDGSMKSVMEELKDGMVLLKLYKKIDPGCDINLDKEKGTKMAFMQMEKIGKFVTKIKGPPLNIKAHCTFQTVDLYESTNIRQVITCLQTVASACLSPKIPVEGYGPKESEENKRHFTEEQMREGQSVIGLQMGSNKGASQSGQNFGKGRHITD